MDSLVVVAAVQQAVGRILPGLDPKVAALLVSMAVGLIVNLVRSMAKQGHAAVEKGEAQAVQHVGAWWTAHRDALNPLLAAGLGILVAGGNPWGALLGLLGDGALRAGESLTAATAAGLKKARGAAVLLALVGLVGLAGTARADEPKVSPFALSRLTFSAGGGLRRDLADGAPLVGFAALQPGYGFSDRVALRLRFDRAFEKEPTWRMELAAWLVF
jgi:hypothetical protein